MKQSVLDAFNSYNKEAQSAVATEGRTLTRRNPLPDPGTYASNFASYDVFITQNDEGVDFANVKLLFTVAEGPLTNTVLERIYWGNSPYDFAALCDAVSILTGQKPLDVEEAVTLLDGKEGTATVCRVEEYARKKGPKRGEKVRTMSVIG